jgi:hypothetical protein
LYLDRVEVIHAVDQAVILAGVQEVVGAIVRDKVRAIVRDKVFVEVDRDFRAEVDLEVSVAAAVPEDLGQLDVVVDQGLEVLFLFEGDFGKTAIW